MDWKRMLRRAASSGARTLVRQALRRGPGLAEPKQSREQRRRQPSPKQSVGYPGDYTGPVRPIYDPHADGNPDPGEIVWTWVPFEEDFSQGKDRPVLVIGRDGDWLLALQVTSKDHDGDAAQEARAGRYWVDIGAGGWDQRGRESEVRVNRIIRIDPDAVRRIGAVLERARFDEVAAEVLRHY